MIAFQSLEGTDRSFGGAIIKSQVEFRAIRADITAQEETKHFWMIYLMENF